MSPVNLSRRRLSTSLRLYRKLQKLCDSFDEDEDHKIDWLTTAIVPCLLVCNHPIRQALNIPTQSVILYVSAGQRGLTRHVMRIRLELLPHVRRVHNPASTVHTRHCSKEIIHPPSHELLFLVLEPKWHDCHFDSGSE